MQVRGACAALLAVNATSVSIVNIVNEPAGDSIEGNAAMNARRRRRLRLLNQSARRSLQPASTTVLTLALDATSPGVAVVFPTPASAATALRLSFSDSARVSSAFSSLASAWGARAGISPSLVTAGITLQAVVLPQIGAPAASASPGAASSPAIAAGVAVAAVLAAAMSALYWYAWRRNAAVSDNDSNKAGPVQPLGKTIPAKSESARSAASPRVALTGAAPTGGFSTDPGESADAKINSSGDPSAWSSSRGSPRRSTRVSSETASPRNIGAQIEWSDLIPSDKEKPRSGGMGTVFQARSMRYKEFVAVKLLKASELTSEDAYRDHVDRLSREAELLRSASTGNRFVVKQYGLAKGKAPPAWEAFLGNKFGLYSSPSEDKELYVPISLPVCHAFALTPAPPPPPPPSSPRHDPHPPPRSLSSFSGHSVGLVMAWEDCGTLSSRLHPAGNRLRWAARTPERLRLLERIADGVHGLHSLEPHLIVHGDIKSENVLLAADGEPHLSDFGLASLRDARSGSATSRAASRENVAGTYHYKAPEMYKTRDKAALQADRHTDVYALATLCWETLSGQRPWADFEEAERTIELRGGVSLDWSLIPRDVPLALRDLLVRGTTLQRDQRPSARDLRDGLRAAIEEIRMGRFDVFLSHCWDRPGPNDPRGPAARDDHAPETKVVLHELSENGLRIWVDKFHMGRDPVASMKEGIAASTIMVALISKKYASSWACQTEFAEARRLGKPIVTCIVEPDDPPGVKWLLDPPRKAATSHETDIYEAVKDDILVLMGRVTALPWMQDGAPSAAQKTELLEPEAFPRLLTIVNNHIKREEKDEDEDSKNFFGT